MIATFGAGQAISTSPNSYECSDQLPSVILANLVFGDSQNVKIAKATAPPINHFSDRVRIDRPRLEILEHIKKDATLKTRQSKIPR